MDDKELEAVASIQACILLLEQILTYKRFGNYQFQGLFPKEHACWEKDASVLKSSANQFASRLGYWSRKLTDEMAASDRICAKYGEKSRKARQQADRLKNAADGLEKAYQTFMDEVVR